MPTLNLHNFLTSASVCGTSGSYLTDWVGGEQPERSLIGTLTAGAHIDVFVYLDKNETIEHKVSTISASSFSLVLDGPVAKIKVIKTVASGTANVQGLV